MNRKSRSFIFTIKERAYSACWKTVFPLLVVGVMVMFLTGCGGSAEIINTDVHLPDMGQTGDPGYTEGWQNLQNGKVKQAVKNFNRSNMEEEKLLVAYGYAFLVQNKFSQAKTEFEKCLALAPENLLAQLGLANMYELSKDNERAYQYYSKLRVSHPDDPWIKARYEFLKTSETQNYLKLAERYKNEKNTDAYLSALESASMYSPDMVKIKVEMGDIYLSRMQYEKAMHQFELALEVLPNNEELMSKLAGIYENTKKYDSALLLYQKMQEQKPSDKTITRKIESLKVKFNETSLPEKFKSIFFKQFVAREDLAALLGYYFDKYLEKRQPLIITDIGNSFARDYIIRVCSLGIMNVRPDHSFDRFPSVTRATLAVTIDALLKYLEKSNNNAYIIQFTPVDKTVEPADISHVHKDFEVIKFLLNAEIMKVDASNNFNPAQNVTPSEVLLAIQKISNSIRPVGKK